MKDITTRIESKDNGWTVGVWFEYPDHPTEKLMVKFDGHYAHHYAEQMRKAFALMQETPPDA